MVPEPCEPFEVNVPDAVLDDLRVRLANTRFARDYDNDDWRYGMPTAYLRDLVTHWLGDYDWRRHEAAMNRLRHYRTVVNEVPIHFIHEPGRGPKPTPLILNHGWPW